MRLNGQLRVLGIPGALDRRAVTLEVSARCVDHP